MENPQAMEAQPTHGDILYRLGELKGVTDLVASQLAQHREDSKVAHSRIDKIETKVAFACGIAVALSFIVPIVITALSPRVTLHPHDPPSQVEKP
jgi:hypothetical protein